jgi:hypothetical protein
MTTTIGLESDLGSLDAHILESQKYLKRGLVHSFQSEARTMDSILRESNLPRLIDFLSLDVEGAEISVLKGINHDSFRFRYILVECREPERMKSFLHNHDYVFVDKLSTHDYLFKDVRGPARNV